MTRTVLLDFLETSLLVAIAILLRYFLICGAANYAIRSRKRLFFGRYLHQKLLNKATALKEIAWSCASSLVYGFAGGVIILGFKSNSTAILIAPQDFTLFNGLVTPLLYMIVQDTAFYWMHRTLHRPSLFKMFHSQHHLGRHPSAWTSFSFHPLESVMTAAIIPCLVFVLPIHLYSLLGILVLMTITGVTNHLGWEFLPERFLKEGLVGRHLITATHHQRHHETFNHNYGLYFRFWDRLMKSDYDNRTTA